MSVSASKNTRATFAGHRTPPHSGGLQNGILPILLSWVASPLSRGAWSDPCLAETVERHYSTSACRYSIVHRPPLFHGQQFDSPAPLSAGSRPPTFSPTRTGGNCSCRSCNPLTRRYCSLSRFPYLPRLPGIRCGRSCLEDKPAQFGCEQTDAKHEGEGADEFGFDGLRHYLGGRRRQTNRGRWCPIGPSRMDAGTHVCCYRARWCRD